MARSRWVRAARAGWAALIALACLLGTACGNDPPEGSEKVAEPSAIGDCLRPDPDHDGGFLQADCGGGRATVEIVDIVEGTGTGPRCPAGTDVVADAAAGPVSGGRIEGPEAVWCLRNLDEPHPGDAGMGGGELVVGDCFVVAGEGAADVTEVPCAGGAQEAQYRLLASASRTEDCPADGSEPIELAEPRLLVLCGEPLGDEEDPAPG